MTQQQIFETYVDGIPYRVIYLEKLGWAACVYTNEGRKGDYVYADTKQEVLAKIGA